jgi:nicotinate-nucleotide adenylyltransferase
MDVISRLGILGGTFDPIHHGHLAAAQEVAARLALSRVILIPARQPPHKEEEPGASAEHRLAMVRLAAAGNPMFDVSTLEIDRSGPSYTVDTLRILAKERMGAELFFIVGMDSLAELPRWHDPSGILRLARLVAVHRPGVCPVSLSDLEEVIPEAAGRVQIVEIRELDISSTDIRERIRDRRPIRYLVPDAVASYIEEHGLYRDASTSV